MIDSIHTFGDSFLFGSELSDCKHQAGWNEHSRLTWPAIIAKELKLKYYCDAEPGRGNLAISAQVFNRVTPNSLAIINWSWIDRFDYNFNIQGWPKTFRPTATDDLTKQYYKNIHNEVDDKIRSLVAIYSTISYLIRNNISFICTYIDPLLLDQTYSSFYQITNLINNVKSDLQTFPINQTFLEWSRANNYPESDNWHPLELAHEKAAEYWQPIYEKEISKHITTK